MILVNKKEVSLPELGKRLGITIPIDLIKKKPLFEINAALVIKDPANGVGAVKHRQSMDFPADFNATLAVNGETVNIRYCSTQTPDAKFHGNVMKYSPKHVTFDGKAEFIADNLDKAVYFWLHFYNKTSPFKKPGIPHDYELVDDEARANQLIEQITLRSKATAHAAALSGDKMIIIAKGMKIAGASHLDPLSVKAQLMQFASDQPAEYLNKANSQVNHIHGLIVDAVDKGIFETEKAFNTKRWKWAKGVRAGEFIFEMSSNTPDDNEALITHISQNINDFLPVLMDTAKTINAAANLEEGLKNVNVLDEMGFNEEIDEQLNNRGFEPDDFDTPFEGAIPTDFKTLQQFLGEHINTKSPAVVKIFADGIAEGEINNDNIKMFFQQYRKKA